MAEPEENHQGPAPTPEHDDMLGSEVSWEEQARDHQQNYLKWLGTYDFSSFRKRIPSICNLLLDGYCKCHESDDGYCENSAELLSLKVFIGYALYGPPPVDATEENGFTGYPKDKLEPILKIYDQIVKCQNTNEILMAILYVSLDSGGKVADSIVFRIPNPNHKGGETSEYRFVDFTARVYQNWEDFLSNNKFPALKYCYPKGGVYTGDLNGNVELCYGVTPAAKLTGKALSSLDTVATVVSVGAAIGSFVPPVAVPCYAACGIISVYSMVRGSVELADRGNHGQSLVDREAARQWISIVGSTLGLGSAGGMAAIKMLAREGKTASSLICGIVTGLNVSSVCVNGAGIVENIITFREQDEWSVLQVFQLTTSLMFFTHSLVNFKTARSIYVEAQNQILEDHGASLSKRQRKLFEGMQRETLSGETDLVIGKAKIIKAMSHVSNKNEFFGRILRLNKAARKNSEPVQKFKFDDLSSSQGSHSQTPSLSNFSQHSTVLASSQGHSVVNPTPQYVNAHEPAMFTQIKMFLNHIPSCEVQRLIFYLGGICSKWKYGRKFMDVLRIVIDIQSCDNIPEVVRIVEAIMKMGKELWEEVLSEQNHADNIGGEEQTSSHEAPEAQLNEDERMERIMENVSFIPGVLHELSSEELKEQVFHFPTDHRAWGGNGELEPDEYILIGQNAFGIVNIECANLRHEGDTANVYFEHVGLVTITSYVKEHKIVVKKFPKCNDQ